jgi:hypothetical protein
MKEFIKTIKYRLRLLKMKRTLKKMRGGLLRCGKM